MQQNHFQSYATTALRWVIGWTYFSAFWRRLILENKLDPEVAGYIGAKFNHFLPNAIGIKPVIEYLVSNPTELWISMWIFTIVEAIVGLFLMLGLFTRVMSLGVIGLAMGILLGSGWIGTTCLDEWQIGILGVAGGFTLLLFGPDRASLDAYWARKKGLDLQCKFQAKPWFPKAALGVSIGIFILTLATNQIFHGGVWGTLHNKSVRPIVEIANASLKSETLKFEVYRVEGADVYGSFLIGIRLENTDGEVVFEKTMDDLANLSKEEVSNHYVAKVQPGKHSLIIPLGAKADLIFKEEGLKFLPQGSYKLTLTDISGAQWHQTIVR